MQARNDILEELRSISVLVDGISRQTPYVVPAGYFDSLAPLVLGRVKPLTFSVPDGYFEGFASSVLDRIKAGANHHAEKEESVQEELERLSAVLSRIDRATPYQLPEGYFEELSPVLTLLRGKSTYQVPVGYFEAMAARTAAKAVEAVPASVRAEAPVVEIGSRRGKVLKGNWWKYAAAAVVAGLILTLGWPQLHNTGSNNMELRPAPMDLSKVLYKVSDQEIENYMVNDDQGSILAEPVPSSTANLDINDNDVKTLLGDVPDGELKQYLDEHGRANDIATN